MDIQRDVQLAKDLQKIVDPEPPPTYTEGNLLRKYGIPVQHLDFEYVDKCENAKELEKIYHILSSGEEGNFPALMEKTEEKLSTLKPNSRFIRKSVPLLKKESLDKNEQANIDSDLNDWLTTVNKNCEELDNYKKVGSLRDNPPVRVAKTVTDLTKKDESKVARIKSTDYQSWDKYDVDTELLKMDLADEKIKEETKKNDTKKVKQKKVRINEFTTKTEALFEANMALSKGKEYYKTGDYIEAINCYNMSMALHPTSEALNCRCMAYIKREKYSKAVTDGLDALKYDEQNTKVFVNLANAYEKQKMYAEAYKYYTEANFHYPNDVEVQEGLERVRTEGNIETQYKRMMIDDCKEDQSDTKNNNTAHNSTETKKPSKIDVAPKHRSILKNTKPKTTTDIAIPGSSSMPPPYYVSINTINPREVKRAEQEISQLVKHNSIPMPIIHHIRSASDDEFIMIPKVEVKTKKVYSKRFHTYKKSSKNKILGSKSKMEKENVPTNHQKRESISNLQHADNQMKQIENGNAKKENLFDVPKPLDCNGNVKEKKNDTRESSVTNKIRFITKSDKGGGGEPCIIEDNPDNASTEELHMPFTFFRVWSVASRDQTYTEFAEILRQIDVSQLPTIIGLKLDSKMLSTILQCLYKHFAVASELERVYDILISLANVPRFTLIKMFMSNIDKTCIQNLLDFLTQHDRSLPDDVAQKYR